MVFGCFLCIPTCEGFIRDIEAFSDMMMRSYGTTTLPYEVFVNTTSQETSGPDRLKVSVDLKIQSCDPTKTKTMLAHLPTLLLFIGGILSSIR